MLSETHIELSSWLSILYSRYLHESGWSDGWLDGAFCVVKRGREGVVQCGGLLVWGDDEPKFWLEPFRACFKDISARAAPAAYKLCFRSADEERRAIPYDSSGKSIASISSQNIDLPIDDSDWIYAFKKGDF